MPVKLNVDASDLLRWARIFRSAQTATKTMIANSLNLAGEEVLAGVVKTLSQQSGLDPNVVHDLIVVRKATNRRLIWEMDSSAALAPSAADSRFRRPWDTRGSDVTYGNELVKIITYNDDRCCEVCEDAASNSPYTMNEIQQLAAKWADYEPPVPLEGERTNLIHPNCRCVIQPFRITRRLPIKRVSSPHMPPELMTARALGQKIAGEMAVQIKATLSGGSSGGS